jgi:hypothetical protein
MDGPLSPSGYSTSSNSAGHTGMHISRPSTAMGPNAHLAMAPSTSARLAANTRRRSSLSQPYPYTAFPEASHSAQPSSPSTGQRAYSPPTMVPLSLLEQTQNQQASHRSPIDDSLLKRLPPSTR